MSAAPPPIPRDEVSGLILAAGRGMRFGAPKAFLRLQGRTLVERAVERLSAFAGEIVVGVEAGEVERTRALLAAWSVSVEAGGDSRQATAGNLLAHATRPWVLIHEAARPFAAPNLFAAVLAAAAEHGAAVGCLPVASRDTLAVVRDGMLTEPLMRGDLVRTQSPFTARRDILVAAYGAAERDGTFEENTQGLVFRAGHPVRMVPGDPANWKITYPDDLERAERGEGPPD